MYARYTWCACIGRRATRFFPNPTLIHQLLRSVGDLAHLTKPSLVRSVAFENPEAAGPDINEACNPKKTKRVTRTGIEIIDTAATVPYSTGSSWTFQNSHTTETAQAPQTIDTMFALPCLPGRNIEPWLSCYQDTWRVFLTDFGSNPSVKVGKNVVCSFSLVPKDDRATAEKVARSIAELFERSPYTASQRLTQTFVRAAVHRHSPSRGRRVAYPGRAIVPPHHGPIAFLNLRIIDPETNKAEAIDLKFRPYTFRTIAKDEAIPDVPACTRFTRAARSPVNLALGDVHQIAGDDGTLQWPPIFRPEDIGARITEEMLRRTERFARFVAYQFDDTICSRTHLVNVLNIYHRAYTGITKPYKTFLGARLRQQERHFDAIS